MEMAEVGPKNLPTAEYREQRQGTTIREGHVITKKGRNLMNIKARVAAGTIAVTMMSIFVASVIPANSASLASPARAVADTQSTVPCPTVPVPTTTIPLPHPTVPLPTPTVPAPCPTLPVPCPTVPVPTATMTEPVPTMPVPVPTIAVPLPP